MLILDLVEMLMFGSDFKDNAWSKFWRWKNLDLIKVCSWTCDMPHWVILMSWTRPSGPLCLWQCFQKHVKCWCDMMRHDVTWCDMMWNDVTWCDWNLQPAGIPGAEKKNPHFYFCKKYSISLFGWLTWSLISDQNTSFESLDAYREMHSKICKNKSKKVPLRN